MKRITRTTLTGAGGAAALPTVLYVEDDDNNWSVAELQLRKTYRLVRASTDREACEKFMALRDEIYAVLMDIQLKGSQLDGIDLTRLLRGTLPRLRTPEFARAVPVSDTPVIFVTAGGTAFTDEELLAAGGDAVIAKPVDFTRLNLALTTVHLRKFVPPTR